MKSTEYMKELQAKNIDELREDLESAKRELFNLRFQNATNRLQNIARIQTVITAKAAN